MGPRVGKLADQLYLGRMQLHREIQAITSMTTTELLRTRRLRRAAHLPVASFGSITEVAFAAGFENRPLLGSPFEQMLGASPSEYRATPEHRGALRFPTRR
ncbi:MAG: helix-turn-helix domain-containing protein [Holophagales bacterium]|nr:helix-turn-helix domain-containing protein [Holophagales bacterium]